MKTIFILLVLGGIVTALVMAYKSYVEESKEARTVKSLPPSVQHVIVQMDAMTQSAFFNEYEAKKKKKFIGYLAWFFFGWHYLYVGKTGLQFAFWFTFGGFGFWTFVDLFRMPSIIRSANEVVARQALQTLHMGASFAGASLPQHLVQQQFPMAQAPQAFPTYAPPAALPAQHVYPNDPRSTDTV